MLKITDGERTICDGTPSNVNEIYDCINYLRELIKKLDGYPDNSLFFQNPLIIGGWIQLIRTISTIKKWESPTDDAEWEECEEQYVAYLLVMRTIWEQYRNLALGYYEPLKELMKLYLDGGWLFGDCITPEGIEALCEDHYEKDLKDVSDMFQHLVELEKLSLEGRSTTYNTLSGIHDILVAIIKRGDKILFDLNPSDEDFANAINADLRTRTRLFKEKMITEMEEDLARYYLENRTDDYKPELWGKMLTAEEEALNLAKRKELSECDASKQEHWGKDMKAMMDANDNLMELILSTIKNKELIDLGKAENIKPFISLLTPENLSMFYDIIIRRSLIQCKMFPELKKQHEDWLGNGKEQHSEETQQQETSIQEPPHDILRLFGSLQNYRAFISACKDQKPKVVAELYKNKFGKIQLDDEKGVVSTLFSHLKDEKILKGCLSNFQQHYRNV